MMGAIYCVDNFGSGRPVNVDHLEDSNNFNVIEADIRKPLDLPPVDEVYHLVSRASPEDFQNHPVQIALTNTEGTRNLLDYAVEHDATVLFASTSEVYGDPEVHPQNESYNGNVNIRGPRGCYDEPKRFGETLTVAYHEKTDLDVRTAEYSIHTVRECASTTVVLFLISFRRRSVARTGLCTAMGHKRVRSVTSPI